MEETVPVSGSSGGVNALGLVVFSVIFGLVIGNMKQQGQALRDFFDCLNEAIMRLVAIVIWLVNLRTKPEGFNVNYVMKKCCSSPHSISSCQVRSSRNHVSDCRENSGDEGPGRSGWSVGDVHGICRCGTSHPRTHCPATALLSGDQEEPLQFHWWPAAGSHHCFGDIIQVNLIV